MVALRNDVLSFVPILIFEMDESKIQATFILGPNRFACCGSRYARHEKRCDPENLVHGQISPKICTFWIKATIIEDVDRKYPNIKKYLTQGQEIQNLSPIPNKH